MNIIKNNKKIAWVTGGGTGIGSEIVKILVRNNWKVVISGRRLEKLKLTKEYDKKNIIPLKLDVTSELECKNVVK